MYILSLSSFPTHWPSFISSKIHRIPNPTTVLTDWGWFRERTADGVSHTRSGHTLLERNRSHTSYFWLCSGLILWKALLLCCHWRFFGQKNPHPVSVSIPGDPTAHFCWKEKWKIFRDVGKPVSWWLDCPSFADRFLWCIHTHPEFLCLWKSAY